VFNGTFSTNDDDNDDNIFKTHPREKAGDSMMKSPSVVIQSFSPLTDHVTWTYYFCSTVKKIYPCKITMKKISAYFFDNHARLVGWLGFNSTFSTNRLHRATGVWDICWVGPGDKRQTYNKIKKCSMRCKHCTLAVVRRSQKFSPRRRPLPRDARRPKFNQLQMVTTFTYTPSWVRIDACNFELLW